MPVSEVPLSENEVVRRKKAAFDEARKQRLRQAHSQCRANSQALVRARAQQQHEAAAQNHRQVLMASHQACIQRVHQLSACVATARQQIGQAQTNATTEAQLIAERAKREEEAEEHRSLSAQVRHAAALAHQANEHASHTSEDSLGIRRLAAYDDRTKAASFAPAQRSTHNLRGASAADSGDAHVRRHLNPHKMATAYVDGCANNMGSIRGVTALDMRGREWMAMFRHTRLHEGGARSGAGPTATVAGSLSQPRNNKVSSDRDYAEAKQKVEKERRSRAKERAQAAAARERVREEKQEVEQAADQQDRNAACKRKQAVQEKAKRARWGCVVPPSHAFSMPVQSRATGPSDLPSHANDEFCFDPAEWSTDLPLPDRLKVLQQGKQKQRKRKSSKAKPYPRTKQRDHHSDTKQDGEEHAEQRHDHAASEYEDSCVQQKNAMTSDADGQKNAMKLRKVKGKRVKKRSNQKNLSNGPSNVDNASEELLTSSDAALQDSGTDDDENRAVEIGVYKEQGTTSTSEAPSTLSKRAEEAERAMREEQQQQHQDGGLTASEGGNDEDDDEYESTLSTLSKRIQAIEEALQ